MRMKEPHDDFLCREDEHEKWLKTRPVCAYCREHIQDRYYYLINDNPICEDCLDCYYREEIND